MELSTLDYLKKALLDTQEKVRDFENYAHIIEDKDIKNHFSEWAEQEGFQASELQKLVEEHSENTHH